MKEWSEAILEAINSLGNEASLKQIYSTLEENFPLTQRNLRITSHGGRKAFEHEVRSFISDLVESGNVERIGRGHYRLTPMGISRLENWMREDGRTLHEPRAQYVASPQRMRVIEVEIESLEEGGYMAVCEAIQGCRAEGETVAEALEELEDVARILLELRKEDGLPAPEGLKEYEPGRTVKAQLVVTVGD